MFLDELRDWLALEHNVAVSISCLDRNIREAGLSSKLLRRHAVERNEMARAAWRADMGANFIGRQLIFVDESSKDERTIYRHYGRSFLGQRATISAPFVRGDRYSILPAITMDGYVAVRIVPGSVDAAQFFDFIVQEVVCALSIHTADQTLKLFISIAPTYEPLSSRQQCLSDG